jgi:hypothetical protein
MDRMKYIEDMERELIKEIRFREKSIAKHQADTPDSEWNNREIAIQRSTFRMLVLLRTGISFRSRHRERMTAAVEDIARELGVAYPEYIGEPPRGSE